MQEHVDFQSSLPLDNLVFLTNLTMTKPFKLYFKFGNKSFDLVYTLFKIKVATIVPFNPLRGMQANASEFSTLVPLFSSYYSFLSSKAQMCFRRPINSPALSHF